MEKRAIIKKKKKKNLSQKGLYGCLTGILLCGCLLLGGCAEEGVPAFLQDFRQGRTWETGREEYIPDGEEIGIPITEETAPDETKKPIDSTDESEDTEVGFLMENAGHLGYDALTEDQKLWYKEMESVLSNMDADVKLTMDTGTMNPNDANVELLFQCIMMDHPELFYVEGYSYNRYYSGDELMDIYFSGTYSMDEAEAGRRKEQIEQEADRILDGIEPDASDYEKIKYVYETVILQTDYDLDSSDNQNIYSVFVGHSSVCQGYSEAVQYLLLKMGVDCTLVQGQVQGGESHAWNLVRADGAYYYVDATWGDASYQNGASEDAGTMSGKINYDYLCVTTEELLRTHFLDMPIEMPECTETRDNYYVRENLLFDHVDLERLKNLFAGAIADGNQDVVFKCADDICYREMLRELVEEQKIFECLPEDVDEINYSNNDSQYTLFFWFDRP